MNEPLIQDWLERLDNVEIRLRSEASRGGGMTSADPNTGESWERGQVWGHIAEFVPFWSEQVTDVIDEFAGDPISYGRSKDRTERQAGIDAGLEVEVATLWEEVRSDLGDLRQVLGALPDGWEKAIGRDEGGVDAPAPEIIERRLISHLEEHAAQLEAIA